jgi:hypothetical protein
LLKPSASACHSAQLSDRDDVALPDTVKLGPIEVFQLVAHDRLQVMSVMEKFVRIIASRGRKSNQAKTDEPCKSLESSRESTGARGSTTLRLTRSGRGSSRLVPVGRAAPVVALSPKGLCLESSAMLLYQMRQVGVGSGRMIKVDLQP